MSEHFSYDDELKRGLNNLPLPDEGMAWDDMERRLDKGDDRKPLIPPVLRGCAGMGLLLLVLVIAALVIVNPFSWLDSQRNKEVKQPVAKKEKQPGKKVDSNETDAMIIGEKDTVKSTPDSGVGNKIVSKKGIVIDMVDNIYTSNKKSITGRRNAIQKKYKDQHASGTTTTSVKNQTKFNQVKKANKQVAGKQRSKGKLSSTVYGNATKLDSADDSLSHQSQEESLKPNVDSLVTKPTIADLKKDTVKSKTVDTTVTENKTKPTPKQKKAFYVGTGLGLHQLLPIAGQSSNPYNASGRKSSLGDYLPSVYLRLYKEKKWFIQSEFRYGAPQYTRQILFNQVKTLDTSGVFENFRNRSVKKTFYHQLPLSFNYFVLPGVSIGTGISFNKFTSAIVQEDKGTRNIITQRDTLATSTLASQKGRDSNFVASYLQALFEMQYQRKRFSAGMRYSFGLQPYLKFSLPNGQQSKERNSSFQFFIRYELWRSAKK